jgi:PadR family transcriptional regulator PadR
VNDANWMTQMKKGLLELCILNLLDRETMYGYQIVKCLTEFSDLIISEGTIYPLLSRLRHDGLVNTTLVESPSGPVRRNYVLTPSGRRQLKSMNDAWREVSATVERLITHTKEPKEP